MCILNVLGDTLLTGAGVALLCKILSLQSITNNIALTLEQMYEKKED